MNKVKVLIEEYAKQIKKGWITSSTTILVLVHFIKDI